MSSIASNSLSNVSTSIISLDILLSWESLAAKASTC
jgi:hypothetical protein